MSDWIFYPLLTYLCLAVPITIFLLAAFHISASTRD